MIRIVSSRVKTASEAYDAVSRIGESVKRANPKDKWESASSVKQSSQQTAEGLRVWNAYIGRGSDRELRVAAPSRRSVVRGLQRQRGYVVSHDCYDSRIEIDQFASCQ